MVDDKPVWEIRNQRNYMEFNDLHRGEVKEVTVTRKFVIEADHSRHGVDNVELQFFYEGIEREDAQTADLASASLVNFCICILIKDPATHARVIHEMSADPRLRPNLWGMNEDMIKIMTNDGVQIDDMRGLAKEVIEKLEPILEHLEIIDAAYESAGIPEEQRIKRTRISPDDPRFSRFRKLKGGKHDDGPPPPPEHGR